MYNNSFEVNVLVNGNRCKQYKHNGKTYVESKNGSEYAIEIRNNHWKRILAVCSVDGLSVLTGKSASPDDTGYIIDSYHSEKIKGFRFSDDEWSLFKFGYKVNGNTYAQSKNDGSEKNCGVLGIRLYYEQDPPAPIPPLVSYPSNPLPGWPSYPSWPTWTSTTGNPPPNFGSITCQGMGGLSAGGMSSGLTDNTTNDSLNYTKGSSNKITSNSMMRSSTPKKLSFDMGTEWGRKESSSVNHISFERGFLAHDIDIYYASRESLIEMGVPLSNKLKVSAPQSFPERYAKPPKGWRG